MNRSLETSRSSQARQAPLGQVLGGDANHLEAAGSQYSCLDSAEFWVDHLTACESADHSAPAAASLARRENPSHCRGPRLTSPTAQVHVVSVIGEQGDVERLR